MATHPPEWAALQFRLRELIAQSACMYREAYPRPIVGVEETDSHGQHTMDGCTILLPYVVFARLTGDPEIRAWLYEWRDTYAELMRSNRNGFYHGFPEEGEAHHHWEDHSRFLSRLWFLDSEEPLHRYVVEDAAEHIGNWSPDVPAWYDWNRHDFKSYWFGTKQVAFRGGMEGSIWGDAQCTPPTGIYREALYRVAQTCLNAWFATGAERYLAWVRDFMDEYIRRLERLGGREDLVRTYASEGWPLPEHTNYFARNGWPQPANKFVYGRYVPALLTDLASITGDPKYAEAARRFFGFCFPEILDYWHQHYFYGFYHRYRLVTGDTTQDAAILQAIASATAKDGDFDAEAYPWEWNGVQALGYTRWRGPMAHVLEYWMTGEETVATKALQQCVAIGEVLAKRSPQEFIEGFATPHIGGIVDQKMTNPLHTLCGWRPGMQAHHIDLMDAEISEAGGSSGLPGDLAILRVPSPLGTRKISLYNASNRTRNLIVRANGFGGAAERKAEIGPGELLSLEFHVPNDR